jgi:hypothetical protein
MAGTIRRVRQRAGSRRRDRSQRQRVNRRGRVLTRSHIA